MLEKFIEKRLTLSVKRRGGKAFKFTPQGEAGYPDRLVIIPERKFGFIEVKAPGKKMRPLQLNRKKELELLGCKVFCIDSIDKIDEVLDEIIK